MAVYYLAVNLVLFVMMGVDKVRAKRGEWRIREATLAAVALLGGGIGGFAGMKLFHHKTVFLLPIHTWNSSAHYYYMVCRI